MQVKVALANGKARSHKAPQRAPSLRELSSEARLKEYPVRSETTPSVTPSACHLPRRGRSWSGLEDGMAEKRRDRVSLPYNHKLIPRAKELRKDATEQEKRLWYKYLSQYPIRFQRQKTIGRFIADFYCAKAKLAIELDGSQHFSNEGKAYDESRTAGLEEYGITVIRFSNAEVDRHFESVCEVIDKTVRALIKEI